MIYFEYDNNGNINYQHNYPEMLDRTDLSETGILISEDSLPIFENREGKSHILKVNVDTKELYYEYIDSPVWSPEHDVNLGDEILNMKLALAEMAESNEVDKLDTRLAIVELAESNENDKLNAQLALAELAESNEVEKLNTRLALAELAEIMMTGGEK